MQKMLEGFFCYPAFAREAISLQRKHIPEAENRLLILYTLRRLGPVTGMQLLQMMVELDLMNYFTLQLSLTDMESQGQIIQRAHPCGSLWDMTQEGVFALDSFVTRIPASRRSLIDQSAKAYRDRFLQEQLAPADSFTLPTGQVCIRLRLLEKDASLMDLLVCVEAGEAPSCLQERWHACAQGVYGDVMSALTGGYSTEAQVPEAPEGAIQMISDGEWLLTLADHPLQPLITLLLPLPQEHLARYAAARWPAQCGALRERVLQQMRSAR